MYQIIEDRDLWQQVILKEIMLAHDKATEDRLRVICCISWRSRSPTTCRIQPFIMSIWYRTALCSLLVQEIVEDAVAIRPAVFMLGHLTISIKPSGSLEAIVDWLESRCMGFGICLRSVSCNQRCCKRYQMIHYLSQQDNPA